MAQLFLLVVGCCSGVRQLVLSAPVYKRWIVGRSPTKSCHCLICALVLLHLYSLHKNRTKAKGIWLASWVEHVTVDLGEGCEFEPCVGHRDCY